MSGFGEGPLNLSLTRYVPITMRFYQPRGAPSGNRTTSGKLRTSNALLTLKGNDWREDPRPRNTDRMARFDTSSNKGDHSCPAMMCSSFAFERYMRYAL